MHDVESHERLRRSRLKTSALVVGYRRCSRLVSLPPSRAKAGEREIGAKNCRVPGFLAAELGALRNRGQELLRGLPLDGSGQVYVPVPPQLFWSAEEDYFAACHSLAADVALLPAGLGRRVVAAYTRAKVVVDTVRVAAHVSQMSPGQSAPALTNAARAIQDAVAMVDALIPELEAIAARKRQL